MEFLPLCQLLARECGVAGTGPVSVVGQIGLNGLVVEWAKEAWTDIQRSRGGKWKWLNRRFSFDTIAAQHSYAYPSIYDTTSSPALIDRFNAWYLQDEQRAPKIYLKTAGVAAQTYLIYAPWEWFVQIYRIGTGNTMTGRPVHITVDPQDNIVLGPIPNAVYTVDGEYLRGPQILAVDTDVPEAPEQYHKLIVWNAMLDYGYRQAGAEQLARAQVRGKPLMRQMAAKQLPTMRLSRPMA